MDHELIVIIDLGGKYIQTIARAVRQQKVYCEVYAYDKPIEEIKAKNPKGIILTGSLDANDTELKDIDKELFELGIPVFGICQGYAIMAAQNAGNVKIKDDSEYVKSDIVFDTTSMLFDGIGRENVCWANNAYEISELPRGFKSIASDEKGDNAAISNEDKKLYAVKFHPEASETANGDEIIKNFIYKICGCKGDWLIKDFANNMIEKIKTTVGNQKVLCALSGGVDSSVAAVMVNKAIGKNLTCIFVDHGLMRLNEGDEIMEEFSRLFDMNIVRVNAQERFISKLKGISEPETKRKIIGEEFIRIFEEEAKKIGSVDFLCQGTIYPDVIESGAKGADVIKSHHNVGGLPDVVDFKEILEPLRDLFKDEVREAGMALGIPKHLVNRQPFPGPGLGIRIMGEVTKEKLDILRLSDYIYRDEIAKANLDTNIWQYFTVITGVRSVGVKDGKRTYSHTLALRAVSSVDAMSADWYRIPYDVLEKISTRITDEVPEINRIVYDITPKPPGTIEWE